MTKHTMGWLMFKKFGFYLGVLVLAAAVWEVQHYLRSAPAIYDSIPIQTEAVSAFLEMNRLLTTLATTLLGALGLLLFGGFKGKSCSRELWAAVVGAVSVSLSIYCGYVAYLSVISMLEEGTFDPYSPQLLRAQYAHFYSFLVGVIFIAGFVYQNMGEADSYEKSQNAGGS
jgi:hypothetical protein